MNGAHLPPELWLYIAENHLFHLARSLAALASTNYEFYTLLLPFQFRAVSVKLTPAPAPAPSGRRLGGKAGTRGVITTTSYASAYDDDDSESPAERFAELLQSRPELVDRIQYLWIGHDGDGDNPVTLRAIDDRYAYDMERRKLGYILSRPFSRLECLIFSFRTSLARKAPLGYAGSSSSSSSAARRATATATTTSTNRAQAPGSPVIPPTVLRGMLSVLSLPSLRAVSVLVGSIPAELYTCLCGLGVESLDIACWVIEPARRPGPGPGSVEPPSSSITNTGDDQPDPTSGRVLRTLRIDTCTGAGGTGTGTVNTLLPKLLHDFAVRSQAQLTTLIVRFSTFRSAFHLTRSVFPAVRDLGVYFCTGDDDDPGPDVLDLNTFPSLRALTLSLALQQKTGPTPKPSSARLDWALDVVQRLEHALSLESISVELLVSCGEGWVSPGRSSSARKQADQIVDLPAWSRLGELFSPSALGSASLRWPVLRHFDVVLRVAGSPGDQHNALGLLDLEERLRRRLQSQPATLGDRGGLVSLYVQLVSASEGGRLPWFDGV